ncbi:hypothetical protein H9623_18220 [Oerskovia sp. Sa1BUA8]|uniref:ATP-grasp domain-containing protein n=1 Tax=Oerskovia douganii TaxID=2762210 RepID=A0A9D5UFQ5_9CELL|nr:peptide ligase PGM1-related protein [Oerskovia douganii]MBE7702231.1 hypothetical protein [Oerskovia douganii]
MPKVIIPNVPEEMVGDISRIPVEKRRAFGLGSQRLLWYAEDGDVVVLPTEPTPEFVAHVTSLTGVAPETLRFVSPPPGVHGGDILTADRLVDPRLVADLREALVDRAVDSVVCIYSDLAVAHLVAAAGIGPALAGFEFSSQDGDALANSKAVFRAVAVANGVPVAPGGITSLPEVAEHRIEEILGAGNVVMVKQQYSGGGLGNEILAREEGVRPQGAATVRLLADREAVHDYVRERWDWLTGHKGHATIVEQFFEGAVTVYVEFVVTDDECVFRGAGEILMEPVATGEVIPPQSVEGEVLAVLVELGRRACEPYRAMGYRGTLCADGIVTPDGGVYFTEVNGRLTASSHLHVNLIDRVVGREWRDRRVFLERASRWEVPSLTEALTRLAESGLGYDPATRTGVVVTADYTAATGRVTYCVVAETYERALDVEAQVLERLSGAGLQADELVEAGS